MKIFLVLTVALVADFAMGDIDMCFMEKQTEVFKIRTFVDHYPENNHTYFGVKACPEDVPLIGATFGNPAYYFFIIFGKVFGSPAAVQIMIEKEKGQPQILWFSKQVMLNCNEVKYFWMKWSEGELAIGQGLELGSRTLYTINDADVRPELYSSLIYMLREGTAEFENQCGE
ncbi:hypothetical protein CAPTEDRAFT_207295 [Capitella teleta]|uniref:Farnesoic acid O-methyl transferase domain-containing protein n=1 Tax=Capitella teleta TaxID=283909 RepID=R7UNG1_CAPTE|nr:hypothetical protein CAPTEDRAFT_207295 [Capitella teleta]|eukprot:ELU05482.1 hypothetical protein CAPTEDRAFT_207295 [Capitella teleta]